MKAITEQKDIYNLEVSVNTSTCFIENLRFSFNSLSLINEEGNTKIFKDRRVVFSPEKTVDGFRVELYIVNEGDDLSNRIDYLMDEDYEIESLDIDIINTINNKKYDYKINFGIGEQLNNMEIECEVADNIKSALNFLCGFSSDDSDNSGSLYLKYLGNNDDYINTINEIANIKIV